MNQPFPARLSPFQAPWGLLEGLGTGDAFFSSPAITLLGRGIAHQRRTADARPTTLDNAARELFDTARARGHVDPVIMGLIPFDHADSARLFVPEELLRAEPDTSGARPATTPLDTAARSITPEPAPEHYCHAVDSALTLFDATALNKVVLARSLRVQTGAPIDAQALLKRLVSINPQGYNFALPTGDSLDDTASLVGASPELLIRREGHRVIANPLAGSIARHDDAGEDQRRAEGLCVSDKDLREHALVVDAIVAALQPLCRTLNVPEGPEVIGTDRMWHLSTTLEGELADPSMTSLAVAAALHPTPAVCGTPWRDAHQAIKSLEGFERGYFTGLVGWCDETGDGEWAIAIRCAELSTDHVRVFAGAGVVPGSSPRAELEETAAKMRTMLDAMGLDYEDDTTDTTA
ncbi:isochorismate synthase [Kushneria avicenniae]|uniref:isochorismate synthase n=1 Tax=Kushneria avicenniae TaxID=402385 RepID=A0A1I1LQP3_9GAMM|nr:isochorismate synthase [Kushneria avicenniae]SFC75401.1 isochorismate synthase [Kushneria avicenniae]